MVAFDSSPSLDSLTAPPGWSELAFDNTPAHLACFRDEFQGTEDNKDNFIKALRWSPCGSLLACSSDDNYLRLFDVPAEAAVAVSSAPWPPRTRKEEEVEGGDDDEEQEHVTRTRRISIARSWHATEIVQDLSFHPLGGGGVGGGCMGFGSPLLAVAARATPVHLLGPLLPPSSSSSPPIISSYVPLDRAFEPATTTALCFTPDGASLACGGEAGTVAVFDASRPGKCPKIVIGAPPSAPCSSSSGVLGRLTGTSSRSKSRRRRLRRRTNGGGASLCDFFDGGGESSLPLQFGKQKDSRTQKSRRYEGDEGGLAVPPPHSRAARLPCRPPLTHGPLRGASLRVSALSCSSAPSAPSCSPSAPSLLAIGYVSGTVSVAHPSTGELLLTLEGGHSSSDSSSASSGSRGNNAVASLCWSPCGFYLYSAARKEGTVRCWDVRRPDSLLPGGAGAARGGGGCALSLSRASTATRQRVSLALEPGNGRHLLSGGDDGWVRAFDVRAAWELESKGAGRDEEAEGRKTTRVESGWKVSSETVAAVAVHPWLPLVAAGSGCRSLGRIGKGRRGKRRKSGESDENESESDGSESESSDDDKNNQNQRRLPHAALTFWRPSYTWHDREEVAK